MVSKFVKVATVKDIPDGQVKVFSADGVPVLIAHAAGRFFATADLCTHDNGPLGDGSLDEYAIECPRHGARFDVRTGEVLCLPAVVPIPTYAIEVRGEDIFVGIP